MKNITMQIKVLNQVYRDMKNNFTTLKSMFKKDSNIGQKIILTEQMLGQVYMSIMEKIQTNEINKQFFDIIKNIKKEQDE
jgi:uncharacterized protein (DUF608 family)